MISLDSVAVRYDEEEYSYRRLITDIENLSTIFREMDISKNDTILIRAKKSYLYHLTILSTIYLDAVIVPISDRWTESQIENAKSLINPKILLDGAFFEKCKNELPIATFDDDFCQNIYNTLTTHLNKPATIIFSSGTSSIPKAIVHSLSNHYYSAKGSLSVIPFENNDAWFNPLPLYHIGGLSIVFRALFVGATVVYTNDDNIPDNNYVTHVSLVAAQFNRIINNSPDRLSKIKHILIGGSAVSRELIVKAIDLTLNIHLSYGSTELSSQIATTNILKKFSHEIAASVLPDREVVISDVGEVLVKGKTLALGYYNNGKIIDFRDNKGYYHSRDIGSVNENNELLILGRMDNMFISGGENIHAEEIEKLVNSHQNIKQAFVIPIEDKEFGFRPVCFIESSGSFVISELEKFLEHKLEKFKIPKQFFEIPESLQKDFKISRAKLKELIK